MGLVELCPPESVTVLLHQVFPKFLRVVVSNLCLRPESDTPALFNDPVRKIIVLAAGSAIDRIKSPGCLQHVAWNRYIIGTKGPDKGRHPFMSFHNFLVHPACQP